MSWEKEEAVEPAGRDAAVLFSQGGARQNDFKKTHFFKMATFL